MNFFVQRVGTLRRIVATSISGGTGIHNDERNKKDQCFTNRDVAFSVYRLGNECADEGNWEEAVLAWENALGIFENEYGRDNKGVYKLLKKIGLGRLKLGHIEAAYEALDEALTLGKKLQMTEDTECEEALRELKIQMIRKQMEASAPLTASSNKSYNSESRDDSNTRRNHSQRDRIARAA